MVNSNCQSIKDLVGRHFADNLLHLESDGGCTLTLPIQTTDGRNTTIFIERRAGDYFLLHDGGKTVDELVLQGIKITNKTDTKLAALAAQYNLTYSDETLRWAGKGPVTPHIFSLAACSVAASLLFLDHEIIPEQREPLREQLGSAVRQWAKKRAKVSPAVKVAGLVHQHSFDFVAYPTSHVEPIAISIVTPTVSALDAAERFGFKSIDLAETTFGKWRKLVIQDRAEQWSSDASKIIHRCSDGVIQVRSDEDLSREALSARMTALLGNPGTIPIPAPR